MDGQMEGMEERTGEEERKEERALTAWGHHPPVCLCTSHSLMSVPTAASSWNRLWWK